MTILEIADDREGITITDPVIADVEEGEDGDLVRFSFDAVGTLLELAVETQMIRSITRVEQNEMVLAKAAEAGFDDDKTTEFQLRPAWQMSQSWTSYRIAFSIQALHRSSRTSSAVM